MGIPKYFQISKEIVAKIESGEFGIGTAVPSENDIIKQYQVSNTTARKALLEVERAGWVTRIKGKGTFVTKVMVERKIGRILSFSKNMCEAGRTPSTQLLSSRTVPEGHALMVQGRNYTLPGPLFVIRRLRLADGIPMMLETRYISLQYCPGIEGLDLSGSLYEIYEKNFHHQITEVQQVLSAVTLDKPDMEAFGLTAPIPAFRLEGVSFIGKELILEMEDCVYRGDMYRFVVRALRD